MGIVRFPDGSFEALPTPELGTVATDVWEAMIVETTDGFQVMLAGTSNSVRETPSQFPLFWQLSVDLEPDAETARWSIFEEDASNTEGMILAAGTMKQPGPCNMILAIIEAWQVSRIVNNMIDDSQESSDLINGFNSDGQLFVERQTQIGSVIDPALKLVLTDILRRWLVKKIPLCRPRNPNTPTGERPVEDKQVEKSLAVSLVLLLAGILLIASGGAGAGLAGETSMAGGAFAIRPDEMQ